MERCSRFRRFRLSTHGLAGLALLGLIALPATARASGDFGCGTTLDLGVDLPWITVWGTLHCDLLPAGPSPRRLFVMIERSRWYGWEPLTHITRDFHVPSFYDSATATYNCAGTGLHTFLAVVEDQVAVPDITHVSTVKTYERRLQCY